MSSPASGSLRGLRVAVIAIVGTVLAAVAHLAGGGRLPGIGSLVLAMSIPALGGLWLSRRRRGWLSIAAVLGGVQVVLHSWMMAVVSSGCVVQGAGGGHLHAASATIRCTAGPMPGMPATSEAPADAPAGMSPSMLVAHVLAVLVTALVLAAGERALWQLLHWLRPALQIVRAGLPALIRRPRPLPVRTVPVRWRSCAVLGGPGRRGPPVPIAPCVSPCGA